MPRSRGSFRPETQQLYHLAIHLKDADKQTLKELRWALRQAANPVAATARGLARQASAAVAASITISVPFTKRKTGVFLTANRSRMPSGHEALPGLLEKGSKGNAGVIRHPLFGDKSRWYTQPARPFLAPALERHQGDIEKAADEAIQTALRKANL